METCVAVGSRRTNELLRGIQEMINDNPNIEFIDGLYTDMLIEDLLRAIYAEQYDDPFFNEAFTNVVQAYIHEDCPHLVASHAGKDKANAGVIHYLSLLQLDYIVINKGGPNWPENGFDGADEANIAVAIYYLDGDGITDYAPGTSINQAALAAIVQYARQLALEHYNQPELPFDFEDGGKQRIH